MSEQNYTIERDLAEAQAMAGALVPYIYQDELYGRINLNMPSLTVGALLLRLRRLRALADQLNPAQAAALARAEDTHDSVRAEWSTHYLKKQVRECEARLRDLGTYFKECDDDPRLCANAYMPEALRRTMIAEIAAVMAPDDLKTAGLTDKIRKVDGGLRRYVQTVPFIWVPLLQPVYPQETFWWLYGRPPQPGPDARR